MHEQTREIRTPHDGLLEIYFLGCLDFDAALFLQERMVFDVSGRENENGMLLLCEHPPLITIGRDGSRSQIRLSSEELSARQLEVRWLGRGGDCIVHSPGQLAAYPILPLSRLELGLSDYRRTLERALMAVADDVKVAAECTPSGLSCRSGQFASIGVAVKSWVSYYGVYLDVAPTLQAREMVVPADQNRRPSSLAAQSGNVVAMNHVRESLTRHLARGLGYQRTQTYTSHPLLKRTLWKVPVDA